MTQGAWQQNGGNEAASAVFHLVQELIDRYRINRPVMPIVVAQAEDPGAGPGIDERVREIAHLVYRANEPRRVPVRLLESRGTSPYESALGMVRTLAERPWETRERSQYKPFTFPRSRLLGAIEQATAQVVARPGGGAPADRGSTSWRSWARCAGGPPGPGRTTGPARCARRSAPRPSWVPSSSRCSAYCSARSAGPPHCC